MGLFGKNKNKGAGAEPQRGTTQRKSRRIVAPITKGDAGAGAPGAHPTPAPGTHSTPAPGAPAKPGDRQAAVVRRTTSNLSPGVVQGGRADPRNAAPAAKTAPAPAHSPGFTGVPPRPKGQFVSKPPEFAGDLSKSPTRKSGLCRTGDHALADFLLNKAKLLNEEQLGQVKAKSEQEVMAIDTAAAILGFITEEQMVNALTQECWVPHLKVDKYEIRKKALDTITREDATFYGVFPVDKLGSLLTMAMVNPLDVETIRVLESKTSLDIKKVVATRTEIMQGIEKYYGGLVQAKETSISFTQDTEPKSVTQMLSKVRSQAPAAPPPSRPLAAAHPTPDNIIPEIQDIDDLLSSDEIIAPAIIEPIAIKAEIEIPSEPMMVSVEPELRQVLSMGEPEVVAAPELLGDDDAALVRKQPPPAVSPPAPLERERVEVLPTPTSPPRRPAVAPPSPKIKALEAKPPEIKPPAPAAKPAPVPHPTAATKPLAPAPAASAAAKPATSRFGGTRRLEKSGMINLIPVMEEEFQHAITHGKSHVFEKWVGLQSRNRIINAVAVEPELDEMLAPLYAQARRV
jgi:hypothetical protein